MSPERVLWPVVAVVLAGWGMADAVLVGWSSPAPVSVLVAALAGLPIAWLARRPFAAAGVVTTVLVVHGLVWSQPEAPSETIALLVVAFGLGAHGVTSWPGWIVLGAGAVVVQLRDPSDAGFGGLLFLLGSWIIALAVGRAVSVREQAEQEDRLAAASTRRAGPEVAEAALVAERERIARDLHDVVTHSVTRMVEQAEAGRVVVTSAPRAAEVALRGVEEIGQEALTDLRRMLGLIRGGADAPGPQPGVDAVPALVEGAGATLDVEGDLAGVPAGPSVAAYRIVQGALAAAGGATSTVALRRSSDRLVLEVRGTGPGDGRAVAAMRRRAELYGGTVEAGPSGDDWRVHVRLPL